MYQYRARIINVVDGDTVDAKCDLGLDVSINLRLRLLGINTPERGQAGYKEATAAVKRWVDANPDVLINTVKDRTEKYGRYLATITASTAPFFSLNQALLDQNLAVSYDGGKR